MVQGLWSFQGGVAGTFLVPIAVDRKSWLFQVVTPAVAASFLLRSMRIRAGVPNTFFLGPGCRPER